MSNDDIDRLERQRAGAKPGGCLHDMACLVVNPALLATSVYAGGRRRWQIFPLHGVTVRVPGSGLHQRLLRERDRR